MKRHISKIVITFLIIGGLTVLWLLCRPSYSKIELKTFVHSEQPRSYDTAYQELLKIVSAPNPLKEFDKWYSAAGRNELKRPSVSDHHSRFPLPNSMQDDAKADFKGVLALNKLLLSRAGEWVVQKNFAQAAEDLQAAMALTDFVQQNGSLIQCMVSLAMQEKITAALQDKLLLMFVDRKPSVMPPSIDIEKFRADMQHALGLENWLLKTTLDQAVSAQKQKVYFYIGSFFYDEKKTKIAFDQATERQIEFLNGSRLAVSYAPINQERKNIWSYILQNGINNTIGSILSQIATLDYGKYISRFAAGVDQRAELQILIAARQYYRDQHKWPETRDALLPAYLPKWPTSLLTGEPLQFQPTLFTSETSSQEK